MEKATEKQLEMRAKIKRIILEEAAKNKVVIKTIEGLVSTDIDKFIDQPTDGLLYDLNRLPEIIVQFIDDPKWIHDYAVYLVIKKLKEYYDLYKAGLKSDTQN